MEQDGCWNGFCYELATRQYLRSDFAVDAGGHGMAGIGMDQAVVVITYWEDEVPWVEEEGGSLEV